MYELLDSAGVAGIPEAIEGRHPSRSLRLRKRLLQQPGAVRIGGRQVSQGGQEAGIARPWWLRREHSRALLLEADVVLSTVRDRNPEGLHPPSAERRDSLTTRLNAAARELPAPEWLSLQRAALKYCVSRHTSASSGGGGATGVAPR
jgi:hypothetical protein